MISNLATYTKISPNKSSRNGSKICKITPHHMAGNLSIETCGNVFQNPDREASSNYGIGSDGRIGCYVDENDRSWCSSNYNNDRQAITIEVANDEIGGDWHVSDKALESLINLCVDICKRYNFRLNYDGTPNGSLTRHNMFIATTCPGAYLQSKFPYIAAEVNRRLDGDTPTPTHKIAVDGLWGVETTRKAQEVFGTPVDGIVSNQLSWWKNENPGLLSSTFQWKDSMQGGSLLIAAIQRKVGANTDGYIGQETIRKMQQWLGTPVDGCVSNPSAMVSAFQNWLNKQ